MATENVFQKYLSKKYKIDNLTDKGAGPAITISRELGCFAGSIAEKLVNKINSGIESADSKRKWTWITKEIMEQSAKELKVNPEKITRILDAKKKAIFEDLIDSFIKKYYVSDNQIITTVQNVIRNFAYEGRVVIVGRAGSVITYELSRSLHVRLIAPFDYRVREMSKAEKISLNEAKELVRDTDRKREAFIEFFRGNKPENDYYDVIINRARYDEENVVNIIYRLAEDKKLL
jgi:cytidylate kinase